MARVESHFEFWPLRVPRSLPLPETSVFDNLQGSARRYPEKAAIVYYGTEISYRRLLDEAERLAGYLQQEPDVKKGDRVVLYAQNSPQFAVAFYAILRLGAVVVPLNPMLVAAELGHYVEDSGAKVAIAGQELYDGLSGLLGENGLSHIVVAAYSDYLEAETDLEIPDVVTASREEIKDGGVVLWNEALSGGLRLRWRSGRMTWRCCRTRRGRRGGRRGAYTRIVPCRRRWSGSASTTRTRRPGWCCACCRSST